jgi:hypothetical protein
VEKPVAVYLPGELLQMGDSRWSTAALFGGGFPPERAVDARFIIAGGESIELALKIQTSPEQDVVQVLSANGADQPWVERVRAGHEGYSLDLVNFEYPQDRSPAMKSK